MRGEPLGLGHAALLRARLRGVTVPLSEYCFPNLYLFRTGHGYTVFSARGEAFVEGTSRDGLRYAMPTRDVRLIADDALIEALSGVEFLFPIPEEWLGRFSGAEFRFEFLPGDADYVYSVEKMGVYPGRRLHAKRNLLKQFTEGYRHAALPLTTDRLGDALQILEAWSQESGEPAEAADYLPCREALERCDELVLCGGIFYADDEPAGFVLGEELNDETFVLHFAKGLRKFKGLYQFMFSSFARILPPRYRLINLEQDLDHPALRHAKSSYLPDLMLKKARVSRRGGVSNHR